MRDMARIADFFFECGMLRHTPRSGYAFLGSGRENVAEHTCRVAMIGYALATLAEVDSSRVVLLCLFHDLHEARTGDFNYVNHKYDSCNARAALEDCTRGTGLEQDILGMWHEFEDITSPEALIARDADQLDLLCNLRVEQKHGNPDAGHWMRSAMARLRTPLARKAAEAIQNTDPANWWYGQFPEEWWINRE